jgi:hypothetical protein
MRLVPCERMRLFIRLFSVGFLLSLSGNIAYSCTCLQTSHRNEFRQVDAIFSGRVISKIEDRSYRPPKLNVAPRLQERIDSTKRFIIRFELERRFKGVRGKTVDLTAYESDSLCAGMTFDVGEHFLIYAYRKPEGLTDGGLCSRTRKLDEDSRDYRELRSIWFRTSARLHI